MPILILPKKFLHLAIVLAVLDLIRFLFGSQLAFHAAPR